MPDIKPDPHRLDRVHVTNVRFFSNLNTYGVEISDGGHLSWRQWCEWGREELRRTALAANPLPGETEGGGDGLA